DVSTEILPWHDLLDRFQRIAQSADRLQPALNIEKALLPHNPPAPSAHDRARSSSQIRGDLARGISRGALKPSPLSRASQARPKAQLPRAGASSRELHVFEITRLVVDADTRRRDPACELAGFDHLTHQALYEVAVILRRQPLVLLLVPPCRVDQLPARRRRDVLELADLPVEHHVRQLESEAHADPLDDLVPAIETALAVGGVVVAQPHVDRSECGLVHALDLAVDELEHRIGRALELVVILDLGLLETALETSVEGVRRVGRDLRAEQVERQRIVQIELLLHGGEIDDAEVADLVDIARVLDAGCLHRLA